MKHPLIIADSHGVFFSPIFGQLDNPWESDGNLPISILRDGKKSGEYHVLNAKNSFFVRIPTEQGSVIDVHPAVKPMISAGLSSYDGCLVSIDGNAHMSRFMCKTGTPFDFYEPKYPGFLNEPRQIIPSWAVAKFFTRTQFLLEARLRCLKVLLQDLPVYFVAPPPPIPSEEHIHKNAEIFNFSVQQLEHPNFRLKIFHAYSRYLESLCREMYIFYVPPNREATDPEGFLVQEFWNGATHAKTEYYSFLTSL